MLIPLAIECRQYVQRLSQCATQWVGYKPVPTSSNIYLSYLLSNNTNFIFARYIHFTDEAEKQVNRCQIL